MSVKIDRVLETCLYVTDLGLARRFYETVLGLELYSEQPDRHCFFRCGNSMLLLFLPGASRSGGELPAHGSHGPGHVAFAINQEEVSAWRDRLNHYGVPIERELSWPQGGYSMYFRDPSGNSVELATPQIWGLPL